MVQKLPPRLKLLIFADMNETLFDHITYSDEEVKLVLGLLVATDNFKGISRLTEEMDRDIPLKMCVVV